MSCAACGTPGRTAPIVADKATGIFLDASKVRPLDHKGRFFRCKGPLNIERCPQGHPIIIQAGGSPPGQELSARSADLVFSVVNGDTASAKANYDSLKQRVTKHGRAPDEIADPARRDADHRRNRGAGQGAA